MATVRDVVTAALYRLNIPGIGDDPSPEDADRALIGLNRMLHGWTARGLNYTHTDVALSDDFPLADQYIAGTVHLLTAEIAPEFSMRDPDPRQTEHWFRVLQGKLSDKPDASTIDKGLMRMPSRLWRGYGRFNY